jgi:hypothetical protein
VKIASAATLAILASGQYLKFEFYQFALPKVGTFYFTNADTSITVGGNTYLTGLTIVRSAFTQKVGLEVQSVDLTIEPQADNPAGPVTIGGAGFLSACRAGSFDGGIVTISKGFFNFPASGTQLNTSPGIVPWFAGIVDDMQAGRFSVDLTLNDTVQVLNVMMPRNILQAGCVHTLFDSGCGLSKATFQKSGTITGYVTALTVGSTALTQVASYFALGVITFTSGVLSGSQYAISSFAGGVVTAVQPWAALPSVGDSFTILPGCPKTQAACSNTSTAVGPAFANLTTTGGRYRGAPFVPQPETLYDGGTPKGNTRDLGGQGGQGAGSGFSGARGRGSYVP